jgi:hypothetical protein
MYPMVAPLERPLELMIISPPNITTPAAKERLYAEKPKVPESNPEVTSHKNGKNSEYGFHANQ